MSLAQLTSRLPWSAAGRYTENRWDIRAEAGPMVLGRDTLAFSSEARVDLREDGLRWQALNRALAWEDTLIWTGDVNWHAPAVSWTSSLHSMNAKLEARGEDLPWTAAEAAMAWLHRRPASWPALECSGQIGPNQPLLALTMPACVAGHRILPRVLWWRRGSTVLECAKRTGFERGRLPPT